MVARHRAPRRQAVPAKERAKSLLVVTEGVETEPEYLKSVRRMLRANVKIVGFGGDPRSLVETAAALYSDQDMRRRYRIPSWTEFDEAWVVFDTELDPSRVAKVAEAVLLAQKFGVRVAASNPCFEYWLVLHFSEHLAPFQTSRDAAKVLLSHCPGYSKSTPPAPTEASLACATMRAAAVRKHHREGKGDGNPSTNMDHLVTSLVEAASPTVSVALAGLNPYDERDVLLVCGMNDGDRVS
ncbi:MAG: RloB domain-containing protein [Coriobacteriia bacterium]|nr:RloB domain-containing protein [Coriobacteriia bacterium]